MRDHTTPHRSGPTLVDRGFQLAYVCAYRVMRLYWTVRHPTTQGSLVALWNGGELLLVRNSYLDYYSLPGGYLRKDETAREAARRELSEEVGVSVRPEELQLVLDETNEWVGKRDHVCIFAVELSARPAVAVDHREVVDAGWWLPDRALSLNLFPPVRRVIERRLKRS
jgi:ADP-ribose pyrophosphatase YjhB (NUDIX family)